MYNSLIFLGISAVMFSARLMIGKQIKKEKKRYTYVFDMMSISRVYDVLAGITIIVCFVIDMMVLDSQPTGVVGTILLEITIVVLFLSGAVITSRYYWADEEESIINHLYWGKEKRISYSEIKYFTIEGTGDVSLNLYDDKKMVIPSLDHEMTSLIQSYLETKHIKYKDRMVYGSVVMNERMPRKIGAMLLVIISLFFFVSSIYFAKESDMYEFMLAFWMVMFLMSVYELFSRFYNRVVFGGKEITCRRFLRKSIVLKTNEIKNYRVQEVNNAEVIELLTSENKKIKISMLWNNSYMIDTYIKKHHWQQK